MNSLLRFLVLAGLLCVTTLRAADSGVSELRGMLATGAERRFALAMPGDGATAWVAVGESFAGWKLAVYRASDDALQLEKDGQEVVLKLAASKIGVADTKATLADAEAVLTKMKFEAMIGKMLEQQKQSMVGMMKKMAGNVKGVNQEDFAAYNAKVMDTLYATMKPEEMKADFARVYSEVFTKGELQGLADFYGTTTGQVMIDKQPEIQQKTTEIMMPRMMAAMPKIQKLATDLVAEQAAKIQAPAAPAPAPTKTP